MLHADLPDRPTERERIARIAALNISREVDASGAALGWGVAIVCVALVVLAGVLWLADARDELSEVRAAMEPCR